MITQTLNEIAFHRLAIEDLEALPGPGTNFRVLGIRELKQALVDAYRAGEQAGDPQPQLALFDDDGMLERTAHPSLFGGA